MRVCFESVLSFFIPNRHQTECMESHKKYVSLLQADELTTENLVTVTILSLRAKNYVSQEILRRFTPQNDNRVIPSEGTSPTRNP